MLRGKNTYGVSKSLVSCYGGINVLANTDDVAQTYANWRKFHMTPVGVAAVKPRMALMWCAGSGDITQIEGELTRAQNYYAGCEYTLGSGVVALTWAQNASVGGFRGLPYSDPISQTIAANTKFASKITQDKSARGFSSTGITWGKGRPEQVSGQEGFIQGSTAYYNQTTFPSPSAFSTATVDIGYIMDGYSGAPSVAFVGDSLMYGLDDTTQTGSGVSVYGFCERALGNTYAHTDFGFPSDTMANWLAHSTMRSSFINQSCSTVISNYGSNDIATNGASLATMQANVATFCSRFKATGKNIILCTLLPRTNLSNIPATGFAPGGTADLYNVWLRNYVANGIQCDGVYDLFSSVGTLSTMTWTSISDTDDGVHPVVSGQVKIAASIDTSLIH